MHPDERRVSPSQHLDYFLRWIIIGLLGWLCMTTNGLQTQMATVIERITNTQKEQEALQSQINREAEDRKAADAATISLMQAHSRP